MDRVDLTNDLSLSRLVYGMWRLHEDNDTSPAHVVAKIEACLSQGITTMDQADIYGGYMSEEILGNALAASPGLRDRIEIVTKCGIVAPVGRHHGVRLKHYDTSRGHIESTVEQSLRLLSTDRIDLLLVHRPDPFMDACETGSTLDNLVASGKVRAVGVSNFKLHDWTLLQSATKTRLSTNQIELSLHHHAPFTDGDVAFLQERGVPPMAWSPLGGGQLLSDQAGDVGTKLDAIAEANGTDRSAVAIAWLLAHPARIMPVIGTNRIDRIAKASDALRIELDRQAWFELYTAALGHEVP